MIEWNDIEKGQLPVKGEEVLWYPSLCFGSIDENGIVSMDSNMGWWDDLAYGFNQPENTDIDFLLRWFSIGLRLTIHR